MTLIRKPPGWKTEWDLCLEWFAVHYPHIIGRWLKNANLLLLQSTGKMIFPRDSKLLRKYARQKIYCLSKGLDSFNLDRSYSPFTNLLQSFQMSKLEFRDNPSTSTSSATMSRSRTPICSPVRGRSTNVNVDDLTAELDKTVISAYTEPPIMVTEGVNMASSTIVSLETNDLVIPDGTGKFKASRLIIQLPSNNLNEDTMSSTFGSLVELIQGKVKVQGIALNKSVSIENYGKDLSGIHALNTKVFDTGKDGNGDTHPNGKESGGLIEDFDSSYLEDERQGDTKFKEKIFIGLPPLAAGHTYTNGHFNSPWNPRTKKFDLAPPDKSYLKGSIKIVAKQKQVGSKTYDSVRGYISFTLVIDGTFKPLKKVEDVVSEDDHDIDDMYAHLYGEGGEENMEEEESENVNDNE